MAEIRSASPLPPHRLLPSVSYRLLPSSCVDTIISFRILLQHEARWPVCRNARPAVGRGPTNWYGLPDAVPSNTEGCMNALLRRRLEMAARARDFLRAHQSEVQSETT